MTPEFAGPLRRADEVSLHLGRDVVFRLRLPGPPRFGARARPIGAAVGSLASASQRFARSLARDPVLRRGLSGPEPVAPALTRTSAIVTRPPRWWRPVAPTPTTDGRWRTSRPGGAAVALPGRGLPRAARRVPDERSWTPGGIVTGLKPELAAVRRHAEVTAAGPMTTSHDVARLTPPPPARPARAAPTSAPPSAPTQRARGRSLLARVRPEPDAPPDSPPDSPPARAPAAAATELPPAKDPPAKDPPAAAPESAGTAAAPAPRRAPPPQWRPGRSLRLDAVRDRSEVSTLIGGHREVAPTRTALRPGPASLRLPLFTLSLGRRPLLSVTTRPKVRPALPTRLPSRRGPAFSRPVTPSLRVRTTLPKLPALPRVSRLVNGELFSVGTRTVRRVDSEDAPPPTRPMVVSPRRTLTTAEPTAVIERAPADTTRPAVRTVALPLATHRSLGTALHRPAAVRPVGTSLIAAARTVPTTVLTSRPRADARATRPVPTRPAPRRTIATSVAGLIGAVGRTRRDLAVAATRTQAVAMRELLVTRDAARRTVARQRTGLATAFAAAREIRVATHAPAEAEPAAPRRDGPTIGLARAATRAAAPPSPPTQKRKPSLLGRALDRATTLAAKGAVAADRAKDAAEAKATRTVRETRDTARQVRTLLPAPPRMSISIDRAPAGPRAAAKRVDPPVAVPTSGRLVPGPDGSLRPSLIDSTAALFAATFGGRETPAPPAVHVRGPSMATSPTGPVNGTPAPERSLLDDPRAMRELTDQVVERLEARVIDELERRGRRHLPGAF